MIPKPLSAVIFDKDGLLLDTETVVRTAMFQACKDLGHRMTDELHLGLIGQARDANDATLIAHYGADFPLADYREKCRVYFEDICRTEVPVKPGARELLQFLRARRIPTAVATSTGRARSEENLRRAGFADFVDALVSRDDVALAKPHPESFLKAAALLGVRSRECLALEDSHLGVRAAHAAGMATIMVPDMLEATPDIRALCVGVVRNLDEVRERIDRSLSEK
jgi:HAD superfamily hydrolase (TIGR01509 family)